MRTKPNKHPRGGGRKRLHPVEEPVRCTVTLLASQVDLLSRMGNGNVSGGIRLLLDALEGAINVRGDGLLQDEGVDNMGELVGSDGGGGGEGSTESSGGGVRGPRLTASGNQVAEEGKTIRVYWGLMNGKVWAKVHHISKSGIVYAQRSTKYRGLTKPRRIYDTDYGWSVFSYGL